MPNWKAPGPHFGQGFWLKNFKIFKKDLKKLATMLRKWKCANVDYKGKNNPNTDKQRRGQVSR